MYNDVSVYIKGVLNFSLDKIVVSHLSAATINNLTTSFGIPVEFYHTIPDFLNSFYFEGTFVEKLDLSNTIVVDGIRYTNRIRTLCEIIEQDGDMFHILEAIFKFYKDFNITEKDIVDFEDLAKTYGVYDRLQELMEDAMDIYNES